MCGRYRVNREQRRLAEHFGIPEGGESQLPLELPRFNAAPSQVLAAVRLDSAGRRELVGLRWGLVPHWAKDRGIGRKTVNARAETVAEKPAFRGAFRYRRCLIPSDGFYEWQAIGRRRQPWLVRLEDGGLFAFAGLWERWRGAAAEVLETFTVIVTDANELLRPLHDRMPVIVAPSDYDAWLDVGRFDRRGLEALLRPYPSEGMVAYPVSRRVNSPANDDPLCSAPLGDAREAKEEPVAPVRETGCRSRQRRHGSAAR